MNQPTRDGTGKHCETTRDRDQALEQALLNIFFTDTIGSCHVENAVEFLRVLPNKKIGPVLRLVKLIAGSVSDLLAFSFMENVERALEFLDVDELEAWVTEGLSIYESGGLQPAKEFFGNPEATTQRFVRQNHLATLEEASFNLRMLASGLSERNISFQIASRPFTDTETIYLPDSFAFFQSQDKNMLFYRVATVHKCAQIRYDSFLYPLAHLKGLFPELDWPKKAFDENQKPGVVTLLKLLKKRYPHLDVEGLFCLVDSIRIEKRLSREYQGIGRDVRRLKKLLSEHSAPKGPQGPIPEIIRYILSDFRQAPLFLNQHARELTQRLGREDHSVEETFRLLKELLKLNLPQGQLSGKLLPYIGTVNLDMLETRLKERRSQLQQAFVQILGGILVSGKDKDRRSQAKDEHSQKPPLASFGMEELEEALAMVIKDGSKEEKSWNRLLGHLRLEAKEEILEKLKKLGREIVQDLGKIPSFYVSSALDMATGTYDPTLNISGSTDNRPVSFSFFTYPEWDFRRNDYRQNWCTLKEMTAKGASGTFVQNVIGKDKGQINSLRRQFEMIRQDYSIVRRQRDGQEIDLDAFVEAYSDLKARLSPSENLYTRIMQNRRDIAVLFLVDMSASTEGWISTAIKESLVLLSLAMEYVGDQYGIFGFSGMRRTGCQYFVIKDFNEDFSHEVKERITGITPRDYTRMGPAIRHSVEKLKEVEARIKILLTLSDGKPEDYDEYKGPYAIEDTRMALMEARQEGIKPFCITIDKEARKYLPRMYGGANYVLVPEVRLLHKRVPEIYRVLTS